MSDVWPEHPRVRMTRQEAGPDGRMGRPNHGVGEEMVSDAGEKTQSEMRGSVEDGVQERDSGGDVVGCET